MTLRSDFQSVASQRSKKNKTKRKTRKLFAASALQLLSVGTLWLRSSDRSQQAALSLPPQNHTLQNQNTGRARPLAIVIQLMLLVEENKLFIRCVRISIRSRCSEREFLASLKLICLIIFLQGSFFFCFLFFIVRLV